MFQPIIVKLCGFSTNEELAGVLNYARFPSRLNVSVLFCDWLIESHSSLVIGQSYNLSFRLATVIGKPILRSSFHAV